MDGGEVISCGVPLLLGLRTFFVACQSFHPQPPGSSTTRSPLTGDILTTVGNAVDGEPQHYIEMRQFLDLGAFSIFQSS